MEASEDSGEAADHTYPLSETLLGLWDFYEARLLLDVKGVARVIWPLVYLFLLLIVSYLCRQNLSRRSWGASIRYVSGSKRNSGKSHKISLFAITRDCRDRYFLMKNEFINEIFLKRRNLSLFDTKFPWIYISHASRAV